ncbi:MAG: GMC family oxidoreductase [Deltaproteobacteria bacterium]|nr:GMC family oxidoreductase [Deltaproteobacteria bacterium]
MSTERDAAEPRYDFIVIGSGFGGSVAALRLAEKGYCVLVVEEGKRWRSEQFAKRNWNLRKSFWMPRLGCHGIQRVDWLGDVLVLGGAGVGGGSLVYANTLVAPPAEAFAQGWPLADMQTRLAPHFATVRRMLGAAAPPALWPAEEYLRDFGRSLGRETSFSQPEVGILFGSQGGEPVADPYFEGRGPARSTCRLCGGCMVGCRYDAKNTLDKNYLFLAERLGARILPETRAVSVARDGEGGYVVEVCRSLGFGAHPHGRLRGENVVLAAGALGTVELLLACRAKGTLPDLPPALGQFLRTNSEIICAARSRNARVDHSQGIAIASDLDADRDTHIQIVRYPAGSDVMGLLGTLAVEGGGRIPRVLRWLGQCLRHPLDLLRNLVPFGWARRTVVVLVMQSLDSALTLVRSERRWLGRGLHSRRAQGAPPIPTYLPVANQAARHVARRMGGFALNAINEVVLGVPITAHILGGARMAETPEQGVVDGACRVFGYPGLWVVDGAAIPTNLGANPSLTIAAVAEHAMSLIPAKRSP